MHCFYLKAKAWGERVQLEGDEAHHVRVLRIKPGEEILLLDGEGRIGHFRVEAIEKRTVVAVHIKSTTYEKPASAPIIALALSHAVRRSFFMEKAVELGAGSVWLWQGDMSQEKIGPDTEDGIYRRMTAGAKQCQNPWIPNLRSFPEGLASLLPETKAIENRILPWELAKTSSLITLDILRRPGKTVYVIGPEGGFSERELALLSEYDFLRISLGARILRCETAATLCLGLHWWASHFEEQA